MPSGIYIRTKETKEILSRAQKLRKRYPLSEETKKKISDAQKGKPRPYQRGEKHGCWKGDNVTYQGIHSWFRNQKKSKCDFCHSKERLELALKKGKIHERKIKNYHTFCLPCHRKYDAHPAWNKGLKTIKEKSCKFCKKMFLPKKKSRIFCSNSCSAKGRKK